MADGIKRFPRFRRTRWWSISPLFPASGPVSVGVPLSLRHRSMCLLALNDLVVLGKFALCAQFADLLVLSFGGFDQVFCRYLLAIFGS